MTELETMRHSMAHILAFAVKELYPETKVGTGPPIENGFYYDFDRDTPFTDEDLEKIDAKMRDIIKQNVPFRQEEMNSDEAITFFQKKGEDYKVELIKHFKQPTVSLYYNDKFVDLCRGPHVESTGKAGAFKLTTIAGAYWRGYEGNKMLQRIYVAAFKTEKQLRVHLKQLEEAKKRDHRKLGKELKLFSIQDKIGPGLILYHPYGATLRSIMEDHIKKEHVKRGYELVMGPGIMNTNIWKISGHYQMGYPMYFFEIDGQEYGIKPMNCPAHVLLFGTETRSYRDLPLRFFELGTVHRYEKSGVLHGLMRVRAFTQDDAHIFCLPEQLKEEISNVIKFVQDTLNVFGFENMEMELSTRPDKSIGEDEDWERATQSLQDSLDDLGLPYEINEGDGAFYGPKIDIKLKDAIGRVWQCATIQCDFALPERFDIAYVGSDGKKHRPVMIHRAILGSLERFMGILIEHYAGKFPVWLSPVQVKVLTITEDHNDYARKVMETLVQNDIRVELDERNEKIGFKIREARNMRTPYMLIIGDKEVEQGMVAVRERGDDGDRGAMALDDVIKEIKDKVDKKI